MKALQTVTVGSGGAANVEFTNIPQTYTDLVVKVSARSNYAANFDYLNISFNNSGGTAYSSKTLYGTGGSAASTASASAAVITFGGLNGNNSTASAFANSEYYIPNYASNTQKSVSQDGVEETNAASTIFAFLTAGLWADTSAITSVKLAPNFGTAFNQYSTFTLYGVFNADVSAPPSAPTIGTATAGIESASVTFTGVSGAASYTMTSTPGSITATATTSPITLTGLTGGTAYTFTCKANNPLGSSGESAASNSVTVAYPAYDSIASTTVGSGGSSSITFSSIPSGYTHLQLRFVGRSLASAANDSILIRYNSDSGTNYVIHRLYGDATGSSGAQGFTSQTYTIAGDMPAATASLSQTVGTSVVDILDYSNTNKNKTTRVLSGRNENGVGYIWLNSSLWLNTAAISSITVLAANGSLAQYSRASLYGIKGA
jgi:large repetitive protein